MTFFVQAGDFQNLYDQWEKMLPLCFTNTVFVTPWWQQAWWQHFGVDGELCLLSVGDGDEILGIAPLMMRKKVLSFIGDTDLFDYHDFLAFQGKEDLFFEGLFDYLIKLDWERVVLTSVPQGSPTLQHFPIFAKRNGMNVEVEEEDMVPMALLPSTWESYMEGLTKKQRHELRRKLRRLKRIDSAHQYLCDNTGTLDQCMQDFFRLLRSSSKEKEEFLTPDREAFFTTVAREMASRGHFKLHFLELNGLRVASCICIDYEKQYLLYNSGYDPEYSSLSVGLINKALSIQEAIGEGRQSFDFLRGQERYKYDLGGLDKVIYRVVVNR